MGSAHNTGMQIEDIVHMQIEELALKRNIELYSLIQYAALAADAHACTTERRSWKNKSMSFPRIEPVT